MALSMYCSIQGAASCHLIFTCVDLEYAIWPDNTYMTGYTHISIIYIYKHVHVSMYAHMHGYVCICMYVCIYACMYVRTYVCMYVCMYVCKNIYIYTYMYGYACMHAHVHRHISMYEYMYVDLSAHYSIIYAHPIYPKTQTPARDNSRRPEPEPVKPRGRKSCCTEDLKPRQAVRTS